jgi:hypothetical protein
MKRSTQMGAALAAAVIVLGTAGVAGASNNPSDTSGTAAAASPTADSPDAKTVPKPGKLITPAARANLRKTGHVEITRHTKRRGDLTIEVQRGEITAVSATSITLKSRDGYSHSYTVAAATKVREKRVAISVGDLKVGERAMVLALRTKDGDVARRIACVNEKPAKAKKVKQTNAA